MCYCTTYIYAYTYKRFHVVHNCVKGSYYMNMYISNRGPFSSQPLRSYSKPARNTCYTTIVGICTYNTHAQTGTAILFAMSAAVPLPPMTSDTPFATALTNKPNAVRNKRKRRRTTVCIRRYIIRIDGSQACRSIAAAILIYVWYMRSCCV